jgi:hypothetical protein
MGFGLTEGPAGSLTAIVGFIHERFRGKRICDDLNGLPLAMSGKVRFREG